ncbi:MAG: adenylyltransferase/cytidyltransferase family protein [Clostridia bacterium]|nr:adenylyltransferase/cytidyltransferase family protein [Clostridia bacterium]
MRVGAFIGKFYPPHIGHLSVIEKVLGKVDELYIIISYNKIRNSEIEDNSGFKDLSPELIKGWFEKHYENNPKIKVGIFDEGNFKPYPDDRDKWAEKFKQEFPSVNIKIADESYREFNKIYFPTYEFMAIDRDKVNIHSTMIRENVLKNLDYLIPEAREYFKGENKNGK